MFLESCTKSAIKTATTATISCQMTTDEGNADKTDPWVERN